MSSVALAETKSAIDWIRQFKYSEQLAAAELLNSLQLFDETTVATLISRKLDELVSQGVRAALYAEREIAENAIFKSEEVTDASGRVRSRAMGKGPPAVKPRRGAKRVGSEGFIAFLISQAVKRYPKVFLNQPGPEQFRKSRGKGVRAIVIVTDFIGTGARVRRYLDAFWNVPSVASWHSRRLVSFYVVAASSTPEGMRLIQRHKCKPAILTGFITPTIRARPPAQRDKWIEFAEKHGPLEEPLGFGNLGALIAFRYGIPNNAPKVLWDRDSDCEPFMPAQSPADALQAFQSDEGDARLRRLLQHLRQNIRNWITGLTTYSQDRKLKLAFLSSLGGKWWPGREILLAQKNGLTVPEVLRLKEHSIKQGWIGDDGRLTDRGRKLVHATRPQQRRKPVVNATTVPYYPKQLRAP
jgi:hypothetical protein